MAPARKIVLHSLRGKSLDIAPLVREWIASGVTFVGVVGKDASELEDLIDEICIADGDKETFLLTSSHPDETLAQAIEFAESLTTHEYTGPVRIVEF